MQDQENCATLPAVVIADGDRERRLGLERLMGDRYRMVAVADADSLLSEFSRRVPDLVIADADLTGKPGLDWLDKLRGEATSRETPLLVILGEETDPRIWQELLRIGAVDVLRQPFNDDEVLARVELSLQRAREKKKLAESLDKHKSRLEMALVAARMIAIEWDLVADTISLSKNSIDIFGELPHTVLEDSEAAFRLVHPDDVEKLRSTIENSIANAVDFSAEFRLIRPDNGNVVWIEERGYTVNDPSGRPIKLIAVAADVTSRVLADAAIREREQYLQAIFDATPECIKIVASDGELKRMNAAGLAMIEASPQHNVVGGSVFKLIAPEDQDSFREFNRRVCEGHDGTLQFDIIGLQGTRRHMETHAVPLRDADGNVVQLAVTRDISERKRAEEFRSAQTRILEMITSERPLAEILTELVGFVERRIPGSRGSILLLDNDGQHLLHGAAPRLPEEYNQTVNGFPIGPKNGSCGTAAYRREPVVVGDIANDPLWGDFKELAAKYGFAACWSQPIISGDGTLLGTFAIYFSEPRFPTDDELSPLSEIAQFAGIAIERPRAQAALRESERRFRALTGATSDVIFRMNADWSEMISLDGRAFIVDTVEPNKSWLDTYIHPEDQTQVKQAANKAVREKSAYELEHRVLRVDGSLGWMHSRAIPIFDDSERLVEWFGAASDVTERKQTEQLQREITKTLSTVIEQSPLGIFLVDANFRIAQISLGAMPAFQNVQPVIGRDLGEVMRTIWPEPLASDVIRIFRHTMDTGEAYVSPGLTEKRKDLGAIESYEWQVNRITLPDGSFGVVCYFFDTTRLQQAAAALRESEERFRMLADNMSQLAWTCDELGVCTWYNQRWYEYTGSTFEDVREWGWKTFHHPDHIQRVVKTIDRARAAGDIWEDTFPIRGKQGQYRWFLSRAVPIRNDEGEIVRWFGTNTDVTELRETQQLLHEADRRKDEFLAMLAHELRNPLAPIRSGLDILSIADDEEYRDVVRVMQEQVTHVVRLVDDLLDVSRIMRGKVELRKERTDFASLVQKAIDAIEPIAQTHGHDLVVEIPTEPIWLNADPVRIVQVLENLLNNATKYTDGDGTIELAASVVDAMLVVEVRDEGVGIDREFLPKIFDLFAQSDRSLDRSKGGLGIGLTLVKQLVEMHGGSIEVESEGRGRGSVFRVQLPIAAAPAPHGSSTADPNRPVKTHRIVVVDDNRGAAFLLSKLLNKLGQQEVHLANDGESGLELIRREKPDIVLLDIGLPGRSGYEVAAELRKDGQFDAMLLIALTGYGQKQDRLKSQRVGFDEHLVKPPSVDQMRFVLSHPKLKQRLATE